MKTVYIINNPAKNPRMELGLEQVKKSLKQNGYDRIS